MYGFGSGRLDEEADDTAYETSSLQATAYRGVGVGVGFGYHPSSRISERVKNIVQLGTRQI